MLYARYGRAAAIIITAAGVTLYNEMPAQILSPLGCIIISSQSEAGMAQNRGNLFAVAIIGLISAPE